MSRCFLSAALTFCLALPALAQSHIALTVDTTHSPQKILPVHEVIPCSPAL